MTDKVYIVLGAGYGDEGKGRTVDDIASKYSASCVTRFSGGSQASHSVVTLTGNRHAFRHVGSNTFCKLDGKPAHTHLGKEFLVDYTNLVLELQTLSQKHKVVPSISIDPECRVVTMFDVILNQFAEISRGDSAHGSCGMGIGETVLRNESGVPLIVSDFMVSDGKSGKYLDRALSKVGNYFIEQLERVTTDEVACRDYAYSVGLGDIFNPDTLKSFVKAQCANLYQLGTEAMKNVVCSQHVTAPGVNILEGSQGILLDTLHWDEVANPHTTWASVGLSAAIAQLQHQLPSSIKFEDLDVEVVYVSRCYLTRHGNGPLANENGTTPIYGIKCANNTPNEFQGHMRYAKLDLSDLSANIALDAFGVMKQYPNVKLRINVTCMDEAPRHKYLVGGQDQTSNEELFIKTLKTRMGLEFTKSNIKEDRFVGVTTTNSAQRIV